MTRMPKEEELHGPNMCVFMPIYLQSTHLKNAYGTVTCGYSRKVL